jgi:gas vesicle structural protein
MNDKVKTHPTGTVHPPVKAHSAVAKEKEIVLIDLLDRILDKGVVIWGDVTISVADVDLIYLGLKVLLVSIEKAEEMRRSGATEALNRRAMPRDTGPMP